LVARNFFLWVGFVEMENKQSLCKGLEGFKILFGGQVYRCNACDVRSFDDLMKLVMQRIGFKSTDSSSVVHLTAVKPEVGSIDRDADLLKIADAAQAENLKMARLAVAISAASESKQFEKLKCSRCSFEIDGLFPIFMCLVCSPMQRFCEHCEKIAPEILHIHPLMKVARADQVSLFEDLRRVTESSGMVVSPLELEPNRSEHDFDGQNPAWLSSGSRSSQEKLSPILKTSISMPTLGAIDSSIESLNSLTPLSGASSSRAKSSCQFVSFIANGVKPGTMVEGGSIFVAGWKVRNNGSADWPDNLCVLPVKGDNIPLLEISEQKMPFIERDSDFKNMSVPALKIQEEGEVIGMFVAPRVTKPTLMQCFWRIAQGDECFGQRLKLEVDVIPPTMSLLERQYRKIEQLGFTDRKLIEQAMKEADRDIDRAVMIILKKQSSMQ
jgi:hypothetical protein